MGAHLHESIQLMDVAALNPRDSPSATSGGTSIEVSEYPDRSEQACHLAAMLVA